MKDETQAFNKIWQALKELIKDPSFLNEVNIIKTWHNIGFETFVETEELRDDIYKLATKYEIDAFAWFDTLKTFIIKGELIKPISHPYGTDLCQIADILDLQYEATAWQVQEMVYKTYPVLIRISPYATQNDITDFIKNNYASYIKPTQEYFSKKESIIGKKKKKNSFVQERNDFIYKHKDLPYKEISSLVNKKFNVVVDIGLIGKVISNENIKWK